MRAVRSLFRNSGFDRVPELAEKDIEVRGQKGEFDDCFIYENLIVLIEYTTSGSDKVSDHLKHKKIIFDRVDENQTEFFEYLKANFPLFAERVSEGYHAHRYNIRIVYCSRFEFDSAVKSVVTSPSYLDYPLLKYFEKVASTIKMSTLPELLSFLNIDPSSIGKGGVFQKPSTIEYHGSLLPEEASGFPKGYKVVSFYADADALLQRAYVLRRRGWRGSNKAYQRLLLPNKVEAIREKLKTSGQVAINNIIATLPAEVLPVGPDGHTYDVGSMHETAPVKITLPLKANTIGLIDGQHRLFSYYRTAADDPKIAVLRHQQNLLVTGIIYPRTIAEGEAERFEAKLFLTINSNQSSAPPDLRQEIEVILNPLGSVAISKQVLQHLAASGPLFGHVERYFYDKGKLKTSSIVNFGLVPLLKLGGTDSLFRTFGHENKADLTEGDSTLLPEYLRHSVSHVNMFLNAVKANVSHERWTTDPKSPRRLLTVTNINAFLITMRKLIEANKSLDFESLKDGLSGFDSFDTKPYSSSQYSRMGTKIAADYFGVEIDQ